VKRAAPPPGHIAQLSHINEPSGEGEASPQVHPGGGAVVVVVVELELVVLAVVEEVVELVVLEVVEVVVVVELEVVVEVVELVVLEVVVVVELEVVPTSGSFSSVVRIYRSSSLAPESFSAVVRI
jgi:hypothetical protein